MPASLHHAGAVVTRVETCTNPSSLLHGRRRPRPSERRRPPAPPRAQRAAVLNWTMYSINPSNKTQLCRSMDTTSGRGRPPHPQIWTPMSYVLRCGANKRRESVQNIQQAMLNNYKRLIRIDLNKTQVRRQWSAKQWVQCCNPRMMGITCVTKGRWPRPQGNNKQFL